MGTRLGRRRQRNLDPSDLSICKYLIPSMVTVSANSLNDTVAAIDGWNAISQKVLFYDSNISH
jgi:hypothetical protein